MSNHSILQPEIDAILRQVELLKVTKDIDKIRSAANLIESSIKVIERQSLHEADFWDGDSSQQG